MDGPNVNWAFFQSFDAHLKDIHGFQLLSVGSCGLHTLHNSVKGGFAIWNIAKLLHALHSHFYHVPARREDYVETTGSDLFPLQFCGHRWLENEPVATRALQMWDDLKKYLDSVDNDSSHYHTLKESMKDPLTIPRLHFFLSVSRMFTPFLCKYQTDRPVIMYLYSDLKSLFVVCILYTAISDIHC
jgi:hypothetical protein